MQRSIVTSSSISDFTAKYEEHLLEVRGLSRATGAIHRQVVQKLLRYRFPNDQISWKEFHFSDCVGFLTQDSCAFLIAKRKKCG